MHWEKNCCENTPFKRKPTYRNCRAVRVQNFESGPGPGPGPTKTLGSGSGPGPGPNIFFLSNIYIFRGFDNSNDFQA